MLVELLFRASGTFISCWWNKNFLLRNHLFHAEKTGEMSRHIFHNVLSAPNNPQTKKGGSPVQSIRPSLKNIIIYDNRPIKVSGNTGIAPCCVQTNAEVSTARRCASSTERPFKIAAVKAAVNESPAPTVSATSTFGVSTKEICPGVNT